MAERCCVVRGCPALAVPGAGVCAVHVSHARRASGDAPIHCYACGDLIRIGRRWIVRAEGAFHDRVACLMASPATYHTPTVDPLTGVGVDGSARGSDASL